LYLRIVPGVGRLTTAVAAHPLADQRQRVNEVDIVRDISRKFERAGIAYMLTGSMAMNYYAQP
jgi:hypothetical protein